MQVQIEVSVYSYSLKYNTAEPGSAVLQLL
jgi:hypothetical protein